MQFLIPDVVRFSSLSQPDRPKFKEDSTSILHPVIVAGFFDTRQGGHCEEIIASFACGDRRRGLYTGPQVC